MFVSQQTAFQVQYLCHSRPVWRDLDAGEYSDLTQAIVQAMRLNDRSRRPVRILDSDGRERFRLPAL